MTHIIEMPISIRVSQIRRRSNEDIFDFPFRFFLNMELKRKPILTKIPMNMRAFTSIALFRDCTPPAPYLKSLPLSVRLKIFPTYIHRPLSARANMQQATAKSYAAVFTAPSILRKRLTIPVTPLLHRLQFSSVNQS